MTNLPGDRPALRIALLSWRDPDHPEAGGAEVFLEQVSLELAARGHEVTICSAAVPGAPARVRARGVTTVRMGSRVTVYPRVFGWLLRRRRDFDVVVDVQNGLPFWSPLLGLPVVNLTHHVHREQWPEVFGPVLARVGWWLESRIAPRVYRSARYLAVSNATRDDLGLLGVDASRVTVGNPGLHDAGLPFRAEEAARTATPAVVVLGRLVPHKRVEIAIDAVARLQDEIPGLELWVVGGGYWQHALEDHALASGIADRVHFTGVVDEATKRRILSRAWVHALPSLKEGWGLVVIEAGIHATPTVAFRSAGGTTESVLDGRTGVLVDDTDEFAAALGSLLTDRVRLTRLGRAAHDYAAHLTWSRTTDALETALCSAVGRPPIDLAPSELVAAQLVPAQLVAADVIPAQLVAADVVPAAITLVDIGPVDLAAAGDAAHRAEAVAER